MLTTIHVTIRPAGLEVWIYSCYITLKMGVSERCDDDHHEKSIQWLILHSLGRHMDRILGCECLVQ